MLKVGLTGSIAVGKSHVLEVFAEHGCRVLDADETAREVVLPGTVGLKRVAREFGDQVISGDGRLDRNALGTIVFADPSKRQLLNSILHPLIIQAQNEWLERQAVEVPNGIAIIDAALMIESGSYKRFDELVVVWCESDIQLERLIKRDSISLEDALKKINAQLPQDEKKKRATYLIDSSGSYSSTRDKTEAVLSELVKKAKAR